MTPKRMIKHCDDSLELLELLEGELSRNPDASAKLYGYIRQVRELKHIALKETKKHVTREQAKHINILLIDIDNALMAWPLWKLQ